MHREVTGRGVLIGKTLFEKDLFFFEAFSSLAVLSKF